MNGIVALLAVSALLVAGVAGPVAGVAPTPDRAVQVGTTSAPTNASAEPAAPGAHLAGVVGVQRAEIDGELAGRSFGLQIASANSNSAKASIVADQLGDLEQQTVDLRERRQELVDARRNGTISQARFRAEMAALAARNGVVERRLDRTETTARDVPADVLESKGVNATAIQTLRGEARNVAGPDAADIARSIAGPNVGSGLAANASAGPPTDVPGNSENASPEPDRGPPSDSPGASGNGDRGPSDEQTPRGSGPPDDPGAPNGGPSADSPGNADSAPGNSGGNGGPSSKPDQANQFPWGWLP